MFFYTHKKRKKYKKHKNIKSTKRKQATFTLRRFIRTKSTKNIKSIKSTKRQTSDFLLLECFYEHKNTVFYTQKAQKMQISE